MAIDDDSDTAIPDAELRGRISVVPGTTSIQTRFNDGA